jgi:hypothetical protein
MSLDRRSDKEAIYKEHSDLDRWLLCAKQRLGYAALALVTAAGGVRNEIDRRLKIFINPIA